MALETISKILSPTNATYINGVSAERRFSTAVLENMYQGLVEKGGRGINDKFVSEDDANISAQVFVNRILPVKMKPREQGSNKNGASFSANKHYTQTVTVGIELLQVLDDTIIIPRARQDMIKVDLLAEQTKIYSDRLTTILNGATFASKVLATWLSEAQGKEVNYGYLTDTDVANKNILNKFIEANSLLDEGDPENGIDLFPEDTRVCVVKPSYRAVLKTSGILVIGGANYGYDIAKGNAISQGSTARKSEDGYIGDIDGVPCHIISNESLRHADGFLGFEEGTLKSSPLIGYISSSYANARGVSAAKRTKVVDAVDGQGLILQPYTKFGVVAWYPKGNVILEKEEGFNLIKSVRLGLAETGNVLFKLKGAGSRLFADIDCSVTGSTGAFALSGSIEANDDWNKSHVTDAWYYQSSKEVDFNAFKSQSGTALTVSVDGSVTVALSGLDEADGAYLHVVAVSDDGSVSHKVYRLA